MAIPECSMAMIIGENFSDKSVKNNEPFFIDVESCVSFSVVSTTWLTYESIELYSSNMDINARNRLIRLKSKSLNSDPQILRHSNLLLLLICVQWCISRYSINFAFTCLSLSAVSVLSMKIDKLLSTNVFNGKCPIIIQ